MSDSDYSEMQQVLAHNVRQRRKALGLTQESAAHSIGIATRHFQKLEAGELNITLRTLCRVAGVLGVEVSGLFAIPDTPLPTAVPTKSPHTQE